MNDTHMSSSPDGSAIVVVAVPGDELREFSTILMAGEGQTPPVLLICAGSRTENHRYLDELIAAGRLRQVVFLESLESRDSFDSSDSFAAADAADAADAAIDGDGIALDRLTTFVAKHLTGEIASVWTHNPADDDRVRSRIALAVSRLARGAPVFYAHAALDQYQFVADVCRPLTPAQIDRKLQALNTYCASGLAYQPSLGEPGFQTGSIHSVERFVRLSPAEVTTLYALRHSMDAEAATAIDPWGFGTSQYEDDRFNATTAWVTQWADPARHSLVEVGACEGHLTRHLHAAGCLHLTACEPNDMFRARLEQRVHGTGVGVAAFDLTTLADTRALAADFYVLVEMVYYIQDLSVLDRLPTNALMIAIDDEFRFGRLGRWLEANTVWSLEDERVLVPARLEFCAGNKAYRRKAGSRALLLRRRQAAATAS